MLALSFNACQRTCRAGGARDARGDASGGLTDSTADLRLSAGPTVIGVPRAFAFSPRQVSCVRAGGAGACVRIKPLLFE